MSHTVSSAGSLHVVARCFGITAATSQSSRSAAFVPSFFGRRFSFPLSIARQAGSQADSRGGSARAEAAGGESLTRLVHHGPIRRGGRVAMCLAQL